MPVKFTLRLILAILFAAVAVIFSELIPPIEGTKTFVVKTFVTILAALVGFVIFPDIATVVTKLVISVYNLTVARVSSEILNQIIRLPRYREAPFGNPTPQIGGVSIQRPLIIDTSAIIDGRILDIMGTGFITGLVLIPNFVLLELQQVADSSDSLKRSRGRRGFEIVDSIKKTEGIKVEIWDKDAGGKAVDEKLIKLAKSLHGKIVTTDFNLNKLAGAHGVKVLNVNDLANAVKTPAIPGENLDIKVVHVGKDPVQGVGYLEDGTMVVVEDGGRDLGKTLQATVSRILQGSAGRMIFAKKTP